MSGCGCVYVDTCYDGAGDDFQTVRIRTARREHTCIECHEPIRKGERYELYSGKWDGRFDTCKTCSDCLAVRQTFFCGNWMFGSLMDDLEAHFWDGADLEVCCLEKLTPVARERVIRLFDGVVEGR